METFVLYLYRAVNNKSLFLKTNNDSSYLSFGGHLPLIAIIDNEFEKDIKLQTLRRYKLQPFEINQNNYDRALLNSENLSFTVLDIEFNEHIDEDEKYELIRALQRQQLNKALDILKDIREETEIESLSFLFKGRHFKISKYGVLEVDGEKEELEALTTKTPVAYITGVLPWNNQYGVIDEL
jgi:hypothetical protein